MTPKEQEFQEFQFDINKIPDYFTVRDWDIMTLLQCMATITILDQANRIRLVPYPKDLPVMSIAVPETAPEKNSYVQTLLDQYESLFNGQ